MNEKGIHLDLDTWIVPGQILTGKPPSGSGKQLQTSRYRVVDISHGSQHPIHQHHTSATSDRI